MAVETVEFAPNDPIFAYLQGAGTVVEVDKLNLDSAAAQTLKEAGVKIAIPLMSQGELVGLLNLGHRLGEQEYSIDDRRLLRDLVSQAGPAVRVAQPISQQVGLGVTFALVGALTLAIGAVFFVGGRVSARTPVPFNQH